MNSGPHMRPRRHGRLALQPWLALAAAALAAFPATAQLVGVVGPVTSQSLFFDQALNVHGTNYLDAEVGAIATDNATLAENGPSDVLAIVGLAADISRQGPGLDYHLDSDLALIKYTREDLPTKPSGFLDGGAELKIIPDVFSWTARETYTELVVDPLLPVTPENLESLNYVSTGPRLIIRPTLRTTVTVDAGYSYVNSGSVALAPGYVDLDSHRYDGDVRIEHALTNASSVYLSGSSAQTDFSDQVANINFTQRDALVGFRFVNGRTVVDISGGVDWLREGPVAPTAGAYTVQLSRLISPSQRLSLHALQQLTDSTNLLRLNLDQPIANASTGFAAGNPFTFRSFGVDWRFEANRTSLTLAIYDNTQRYRIDSNLNNESKVADILLTRQLAPTVDLSVGLDFQHQDYAVSAPVRVADALAALRWQAGERLGVRLTYAHNALTPHGDANQVGLVFYYGLVRPTPLVSRQAAPSGPGPAMLPISPMSTLTPPH